MKRNEIDDLFRLLAIFRPGDKHLSDPMLRSAWFLILEPFDHDEVRDAVAGYFRENKYWPDVTDIAKRCPRPVCAEPAGTGPAAKNAMCLPSLERVRRHDEWIDKFLDDLDPGWRERWRV